MAADCVWVALGPALRGRLHALDAALDLAHLRTFAERFRPGQPLRCTVMQVWALLHSLCVHRAAQQYLPAAGALLSWDRLWGFAGFQYEGGWVSKKLLSRYVRSMVRTRCLPGSSRGHTLHCVPCMQVLQITSHADWR